MNIKKNFGAVLTLLGLLSLFYTGLLFANWSENTHTAEKTIAYGGIGAVLFISGFSLIRTAGFKQ